MITVIATYSPNPEGLRTFKAEILNLVGEELQPGHSEVQFYDRVVMGQRENVILRVIIEDHRLVPIRHYELADLLKARLDGLLERRLRRPLSLVVNVQAVTHTVSSNRVSVPEARNVDLIR